MKPESLVLVIKSIANDNTQNNENNDLWCKGSSFGDQIVVKICGIYEQKSQICHKYHNMSNFI